MISSSECFGALIPSAARYWFRSFSLSFTIVGTQGIGPAGPRLAEAAIEIVGNLQGVGVDRHDGVGRRTLLVVRVDPREVSPDERAARQRSVRERRVDLRDRRLFELK